MPPSLFWGEIADYDIAEKTIAILKLVQLLKFNNPQNLFELISKIQIKSFLPLLKKALSFSFFERVRYKTNLPVIFGF